MEQYNHPRINGPKRCYHHGNREAVVRCPLCHQYYCRECVTEHDDRMLCTTCLNHYLETHSPKSKRLIDPLIVLFQGMAGFLALWYGFFLLGKILLTIPTAFHEGTLWQSLWWIKP